jgi:glycogen synthase
LPNGSDCRTLGTPVIATRVGGLAEVVDGCGVLVEPEDVEGLGSLALLQTSVGVVLAACLF